MEEIYFNAQAGNSLSFKIQKCFDSFIVGKKQYVNFSV